MANRPIWCPRQKNGRSWWRNMFSLTDVLTWHFNCQVDWNLNITPVKEFIIFAFWPSSKWLKNDPYSVPSFRREKYSNIFRDLFVSIASVKYVFYLSLHSFMTCGWNVKEKEFSFISYCIFYVDHFLIARNQMFFSPITPYPTPLSQIKSNKIILFTLDIN